MRDGGAGVIVRELTILHFTNSLERGGAEQHMLSLIRGMDLSAFRPILVCPPALARQIVGDLDPRAELFPIELRRPFDLGAAARLGLFLRGRRVDVLHSHLFSSSVLASPIGRMAGAPAIVETPHVNELWRRGWMKRHFFADRLVGRCVDAYIAVSQANARYLTDKKGLPQEKIRVIRNGIDPVEFEPGERPSDCLRRSLSFPADDPVIVCVARIEPQKGHSVLLEAIRQIREVIPSVRLVIVGEGRLRAPLERQTHDLDLDDAVRFVGRQANVADWLAMAQVAVLPSLYEGLPLAALEALAAEKPLVATAVDGTPEVVRDGETGLTVPAGDPRSLAISILRLLRDPALAHRLAKAGRKLVTEQFTVQRQVRETENLYREVWTHRVSGARFLHPGRVTQETLQRNEAP